MSKIIDRAGKGAAISAAENDANLDSLHGINVAVAGTTYTVTVADQGNTLEFTSASAVAVTLTSIATIIGNAQTSDFKVTLLATGAGTVTVTPDGLNTINTGASTIVLPTDEYATIQTDSTALIWNVINDSIRFPKLVGDNAFTGDQTITGDMTFVTSGVEKKINFNTGTKLSYFHGDTNGDIRLTDSTNAINVIIYDESLNRFNIDSVLYTTDAVLTTPALTNATGSLASPTITTPNIITSFSIGGVAVTSTAAELNILDGVTSTAAELNILDGVTSTAAELNILDGVTSTAAELNILDGVTSTATELNYLDGPTPGIAVVNKALVLGPTKNINTIAVAKDGLKIDATIMSCTAAELNTLDGITSTTAELNILDGVTSTAAELNILDGVTSTAAELNILDGVTSTAAELNIMDGSATVQATVTLVGTDGVVISDADVMKQALVSDFATFVSANLANPVFTGTLTVGAAQLSEAELEILDGATVTTAELNILDGVTRTAAEINNLSQIESGTVQATTSGAAIDFTGIPSWVKRIDIDLNGVSTAAASILAVQIGDSGGFETSGYAFSMGEMTNGASPVVSGNNSFTEMRVAITTDADALMSGTITLKNITGNDWVLSSTIANTFSPRVNSAAGNKTLTGVLTQVRLKTGSTTFDAGAVNITYEG